MKGTCPHFRITVKQQEGQWVWVCPDCELLFPVRRPIPVQVGLPA